MREFVFIKYAGDDAGMVLIKMLSEEEPATTQVVELTTHRQPIGFQPNPEDDDDDEEEDEEDTD